jgi:hypothetical protein
MKSADSHAPVAGRTDINRGTAVTDDERRNLGITGISSETSGGVVMSGPAATLRLLEKPAQISDAEKLARVRAVIDHPGTFHWAGQDVARAICRILEGDL